MVIEASIVVAHIHQIGFFSCLYESMQFIFLAYICYHTKRKVHLIFLGQNPIPLVNFPEYIVLGMCIFVFVKF